MSPIPISPYQATKNEYKSLLNAVDRIGWKGIDYKHNTIRESILLVARFRATIKGDYVV